MRFKWGVLAAVLLSLFIVLPDTVALAANGGIFAGSATNTDLFGIIDFGSQVNGGTGGFRDQLKNLVQGFFSISYTIITIMTAVAGFMIVFGIEDGKKVLWQYMLGIGLAINFGGFLMELFGPTIGNTGSGGAMPTLPTAVTTIKDVKEGEDVNIDILSQFMSYYTQLVVVQGQNVIVPIAYKLTLIFAAVDGVYKLATNMISGDKVKFMLSTTIKVGFYLFLISNWTALATAIGQFFQDIGAAAGGEAGKDLKHDSIVNNAMTLWNLVWGDINLSPFEPTSAIASIIAIIVTVICLFLTSIEMFMARIEFYTMMLITIIMLPFGLIERFKFLSDNSIAAVFNLGAKMMLITFIQCIAVGLMTKYMAVAKDADVGSLSVLLQMVLLSIILLLITKKVPELASSFLQGQPGLSGSSMTQMTQRVRQGMAAAASAGVGGVATVAGGAAAVGSALDMAKGAQAASGGSMGRAGLAKATIGNLARGAAVSYASNSRIGRSIASGMKTVQGEDGLMRSVGADGKTMPEKVSAGTELKNRLLGRNFGVADKKTESEEASSSQAKTFQKPPGSSVSNAAGTNTGGLEKSKKEDDI